MQKIRQNSYGFGAVEAVLILVIIGMIGFVGAYVALAKKNTENTLHGTYIKTVDPYYGWKTYTNTTYGFSYKYPATWTVSNIDVPDPTGNAPQKEFTTGLKLASASGNAVNFEVISSDMTTASAWIDIYYGRTSIDNIVKTPGPFKGRTANEYQVTVGGNKTISYVFSVGSKTYVFSSTNETQNIKAMPTYWAIFNKVYESLRIN